MPNPLVTNVSPGHDLLGVKAAHAVGLAHSQDNVASVSESLNLMKYWSLLSCQQQLHRPNLWVSGPDQLLYYLFVHTIQLGAGAGDQCQVFQARLHCEGLKIYV